MLVKPIIIHGKAREELGNSILYYEQQKVGKAQTELLERATAKVKSLHLDI
jgi:hypothetical protein